MPVTMPINSVMTVRVNYTHEAYADKAFNVLHYQLASATVVSTGLPLATEPLASDVCPGAAQAVAAGFAPPWQAFASEDVAVVGGTAQKVYPGDRSSPFNYAFATPQNGTVVSQSLPMQDAITILKRTGYGQRWGLGRVFIPGIPELNQDGGEINVTARDALNDLTDFIVAPLTYTVSGISYQIRPVVTNVPTTGFPRVNTVIAAEVSDNVIKSQRRRRPGKGQ